MRRHWPGAAVQRRRSAGLHDRHLPTTVSDRFLLVSDGACVLMVTWMTARWLSSGDVPRQRLLRQSQPRQTDAQRRSRHCRAVRLRRHCAHAWHDATSALQNLPPARLDAEPAAPATYTPGQARQLQELTVQRARVAQETESVETEWAATDELERAG